MADHPYRLYGMPGSLYTAKVRAALRKSGLAFREHAVGEPRFLETIVPKIQRWIIPVVETPDGEIWQDGSAILDALTPLMPEDQTPTPEGPVQRVIAHLFELFGGEGLLRPAMHYRWNFDAENLAFLTDDFTNALVPGGDEVGRAGAVDADVSEGIGGGVGVVDQHHDRRLGAGVGVETDALFIES